MLTVHIQPNARHSEICGLHGDALKVRVAAQPIEGRANEALIALLAGALGVPKNRVRVVKGAASRHKTVLLAVPQADPALLLRLKSPLSGN
jgi:uncharacterized protein (TIGR00251 family)